VIVAIGLDICFKALGGGILEGALHQVEIVSAGTW